MRSMSLSPDLDIFLVPSDPEDLKNQIQDYRNSGFSQNFIQLFEEAHAQGIQYIRFDADGGEVEGADREEW